LAGFIEALAGAPVVAQVEFPAEIHEEPLARGGVGRGGGKGGRIRLRQGCGGQGKQNAECGTWIEEG